MVTKETSPRVRRHRALPALGRLGSSQDVSKKDTWEKRSQKEEERRGMHERAEREEGPATRTYFAPKVDEDRPRES